MSRRELYKARLNETTVADRRRSRGHERKQQREDQVNKRRLLSDDMSPLREESSSVEGEHKKIDKKQQKKPESRAEQLKRWREEKKKATDDSKKQATSKPSFQFKKLEHKDAMALFKKKTFAERAADDKKAAPKPRAAPAPKANTAPKLMKSVAAKPTTKIAAKAPSSRGKVAEIKPTKLLTKKEQATEAKVVPPKKSTRANPRPVNPIVQEAKPASTKRSQRKFVAPEEIKRDLTQLTAAAKARINGVEKKSNFLKSKHQTIPLSSRQKKTKKTAESEDIPTKMGEPVDQASIEPVTKGNLQRLDSGSQSDPHLSDSAVTSPKHSTPFPAKRKSKSGATRLSSAKKAPSSAYRRSRRSIKTPRCSRTPKGSNTSVSTIEVSCAGGADTQLEDAMDRDMHEALENVSPMEVFSGVSDNDGSQSPTVLEKPQRVNTPKSASRSRLRKSLATSAMVAEGAYPLEMNQDVVVKESASMVQSPPTSERLDNENALESYMSSTSKAKGRKSLLSDFKEENSYQMSPRRQSVRKTPKKQTPKKTPRRKSSRLVATPVADVYNFTDQEEELLEYMSPMKKMKPSMLHGDADIGSHIEILQPAIVQLKNTPSFAKRRSLRLVASETESNNTEQDQPKLVKNNTDSESAPNPLIQKKTPKRRTSRRPNKRQLCATSPVWTDSPPLVTLVESSQSEIQETDPYDPTDPIVDPVPEEEESAIDPVLPLTPSSSRRVRTSLVVCVSEEDGPTPESPKSSRRSVRQSLVVSFCKDGAEDAASSGNVSVSVHDMSVHMENVSVCPEAVTGPVVPAAYLIGQPEETSGRVLQELCVDKLEQDQSFFEVPMDDSMVSQSPASRSRRSSRSQATSSASTQSFSPRLSQDLTASSQEGSLNSPCVTPSKGPAGSLMEEDMEVIVTPRSMRARGRSMAPTSAFKEPGEPLSAMRPRSARRKTEHRSTPSRTPEQMIEILKKSPMIEMSRRRSRHVSSPAVTQNNFTALMNDDVFTQVVDKANKSAPDLSQSRDLAELNLGVENLSLPEDGLTEPTQEELQAAKVQPFRDLVITETAKLNTLCDTWNNVYDTTTGICDDTRGEIRSTVGKAQLLMRQRFKQFTGLVDNCEFNSGEKETSPTDLQGFWDMIYFQIEDVHTMFGDLCKQQENGWQVKEASPAKVDVIKKKPAVKTSKPKAKSTKSNFAAFRAEMLKRKAAVAAPVIPAVPEEAPEIKTFDAGFFAVSSPVRSPASSALRPAPQPSSPTKSGDHHNLHKHDVPNVAGASPLNPLNKENEVSTPRRSLLLSKLRYAPSVNSPLLNDITDK